MGVVIHETGLCAGYTSRYQASSGSNFNQDFGLVTNVDSGPTRVKVLVVFKVSSGASAGAISEIVTIDGGQYSLTDSEIVASPTALGDVSGTAEALGPNSFVNKFGAGVRTVFNIPADISDKPLTFLTYPDHSVTDVQVKICRLEVESVGLGLPCLYQEHQVRQHPVFSKRSEDNQFADVGKLELGSSCPANIFSSQLAISFIYENPPLTESTREPYVITGGLYLGNTSLWSSSYSLTTLVAQFSSLEGWNSQSLTSPYLTVRADSNTVKLDQPFPLRFVLKINRNTRGRLQFTVKSGGNAAICGIKILQIGRNLACAEKPEGSVDKYFKTAIGYTRRHEFNGVGWLVFDGLTNFGNREMEMETNMYADDDSIEVLVFFTTRGNATITSLLNGVSKEVAITASQEKADSTGLLAFEFVSVPLNDDDKIYPKIPKTYGILIDVPVGYSAPVRIKFSDKDFSIVDYCSIKVTRVGRNLPCINQQKKATFPSKTESSLVKLDDLGNPAAYKEIYLDLTVCYFHNSDSLEENKFQAECSTLIGPG